MPKITAIHGGSDWADASATYLVLPPGMDAAAEQLKWTDWYKDEYCAAFRRGERIQYIGLHDWLLRNGAREATDQELEVVWDD